MFRNLFGLARMLLLRVEYDQMNKMRRRMSPFTCWAKLLLRVVYNQMNKREEGGHLSPLGNRGPPKCANPQTHNLLS